MERLGVAQSLKLFLLVSFLSLSTGCALPHIGMYVVEDGSAPDADQDRVLDDRDRCRRTPLGTPVDHHGCPDDDDNDKVANGKDQCPATPPGVVVNAWGCSVDSDGDGVLDLRDQCPDTPPGMRVDGVGCTLDADRDGVMDYKDRCLDTQPGERVDHWGCAQVRPRVRERDSTFCSDLCQLLPVLDDVLFMHDKATLRPAAYAILNDVVDVLKEYNSSYIQVVGHTDSSGTDEYNMKLSRERAQAVVDYLVGHGIREDRLKAIGRGEEFPVATNSTQRGRASNRRVVFVVE